jgi:hypothetical protein
MNIQPLEPEGLKQSPQKPVEIPELEKIHIQTKEELQLMNFLTAIWNYLNGNKTALGLVIIQIASWLPQDTTLFGFIPVVVVLNWLGGVLSGGGIVHKLVKANTLPGATA